MYGLTLGTSLENLISEMSITSMFCIIIGLMFVIMEFYNDSNNILSLCGTVMLIAGVSIRMISGGTLGMLFILILIIISVLFAAHILMLIIQKRNWLIQSLTLALSSADYAVSSGDNFSYLKNLKGIATTDIDNTGHISINDINFFVYSLVSIKKGSEVKVVEIDGDKIIVSKVSDNSYKNTITKNKKIITLEQIDEEEENIIAGNIKNDF